jgi:Homeodomain-like domain
MLLPVNCLLRRADAVVVIGEALAWAAAGWGHRRIAEWLGRPATTVRGWLRRFSARAGPLRAAFTGLLCELDPDPRVPEPAGSPAADAVAVIVAVAVAVAARWGWPVFTVSPWRVVAAVSAGRLLVPGTAVELINTSRLW